MDGERLLEATQAALDESGATLLSAGETAAIEEEIAQLKSALQVGSLKALKLAIDRLNHATAEFASRRMDLSIRQALKGHRIDEITAKF